MRDSHVCGTDGIVTGGLPCQTPVIFCRGGRAGIRKNKKDRQGMNPVGWWCLMR